MQFKQIAVTRVGNEGNLSGYGVALFALTEEGNVHQGEWKKVSAPKE